MGSRNARIFLSCLKIPIIWCSYPDDVSTVRCHWKQKCEAQRTVKGVGSSDPAWQTLLNRLMQKWTAKPRLNYVFSPHFINVVQLAQSQLQFRRLRICDYKKARSYLIRSTKPIKNNFCSCNIFCTWKHTSLKTHLTSNQKFKNQHMHCIVTSKSITPTYVSASTSHLQGVKVLHMLDIH